jgi:hypothetical protein
VGDSRSAIKIALTVIRPEFVVEDGGVSIDARMSALGQKADVTLADCDVRFTPESGHVRCN